MRGPLVSAGGGPAPGPPGIENRMRGLRVFHVVMAPRQAGAIGGPEVLVRDHLLPMLPPQGYSDFLFSWVLMYAKAQTVPPFKKLRFNNFAILGSRGSWQQGTTPLSRRIPCYVETIEEDIGDGIWRCPINLALEQSL